MFDGEELHKLNRRLDALVTVILEIDQRTKTMDANVQALTTLVPTIQAAVAKLGTDLQAVLATVQGVDPTDEDALGVVVTQLTAVVAQVRALDASLTTNVPPLGPVGTTGSVGSTGSTGMGNPGVTGTTGL